jgi:hypothetical protein
MAVSLSPVGGAAWQFLDNSGNVLTGGKIYTYLAGTTTPAATYTSNTGVTNHTNPIILDAAGRVPAGGEIWLTDGINYKFVIKDANDVLLGTYDNITGINSSAKSQGYVTATQAQTVVSVPFSYALGINSLNVYVNGNKQVIALNYTETTTTTITFLTGLNVGDIVEFTQ